MLSTFRNIAAIVVTWVVCSYIAGLIAYVGQFVFSVVGDSDRPGSTVLMHLVPSIPQILMAVAGGVIAAMAVRPKADIKWLAVLAGLLLFAHVVSSITALPLTAWRIEDFIGIGLIGVLLVVGVGLGRFMVQRRMQQAG